MRTRVYLDGRVEQVDDGMGVLSGLSILYLVPVSEGVYPMLPGAKRVGFRALGGPGLPVVSEAVGGAMYCQVEGDTVYFVVPAAWTFQDVAEHLQERLYSRGGFVAVRVLGEDL